MSEHQDNPYAAPTTEADQAATVGGVGPHNYATLGQRFAGALIDGLIMIPVFVFLVLLLLGVLVAGPVEGSGVQKTLNQLAALDFVGGLVFGILGMGLYIAIQWKFWKSTSQSIGKMVMKTQIVNLDGTPAAVKTIAFKRYGILALLGIVIPNTNITSLISLIDSLLIFRGDRNCLHDDIAQTRVIIYRAK